MRDAVAGEDVVKARGETYLPRLTGQEAYRGYVLRALFFGATGRTLQGLLGAVMRKDPVVTLPAPAGAHPGLLEFNGQGLKHLENALVEKRKLMVQLGARMLETQKRSTETAEALRLRQAGDSSVLAILANTASRGRSP